MHCLMGKRPLNVVVFFLLTMLFSVFFHNCLAAKQSGNTWLMVAKKREYPYRKSVSHENRTYLF